MPLPRRRGGARQLRGRDRGVPVAAVHALPAALVHQAGDRHGALFPAAAAAARERGLSERRRAGGVALGRAVGLRGVAAVLVKLPVPRLRHSGVADSHAHPREADALGEHPAAAVQDDTKKPLRPGVHGLRGLPRRAAANHHGARPVQRAGDPYAHGAAGVSLSGGDDRRGDRTPGFP